MGQSGRPCRSGINHSPTAPDEIRETGDGCCIVGQSMNEITTALMGMGTGMRQSFVGKYELSTNCVGGIWGGLRQSFCRQSMNDPPTALVGLGTSMRQSFVG